MLNQFRNAVRSRIGAVFIAVLVMAFSIWGVSDIFRGRVADAVIVAGGGPFKRGEAVTTAQFRSAFDRELSSLTNVDGSSPTREEALAVGYEQQVAQRLGLQAVVRRHAQALGVVATDDSVRRVLARTDAFIDPITNAFDENTYRELLFNNNMSPAAYERDLRNNITQTQVMMPIVAGITPPDAIIDARLRFENERRDLAIISIPASASDDIEEPTAEEVAEFYAQRADVYRRPQRRALSIVTMRVSDFVDDAPVDEELLQAQYEVQVDRLGTPETRDIVEISADDEETARQVAERLRAGEDAAEVAAALGLAAPNVYDDALPGALFSRAAAEAALELDVGGVSDPVDGGLAWFVVRVDEITPGVTPSFEEVRAELQNELALDSALTMQFDAIDAFELALGDGGGLERGAVAAGVPVFSLPAVDARGLEENGEAPLFLITLPDILRAGFELPAEGATSELRLLGEDGYFAVRVDKIYPAAVQPLEEIEDRVRADQIALRRSERLTELAEAARVALETGAAPSEAAETIGAGASGERSELTRIQTTPTITPNLLAQAFAVGPGSVVVGSTPGGGRAVVRVDEVLAGDPPSDERRAALRQALTGEIGSDVEQLYLEGLRARYPIRIDQRLLSQALGIEASR